MTKYRSYLFLIIISTVFFCVLSESFSLKTWLIGFCVAIISTLCVFYFFKDPYQTTARHKPFLSILRYGFVLLIEIFKAAIHAINIILYQNDTSMVITIKTEAKDEWTVSLIANAITLTPGTVTIDMTDDTLTVLWLNPTTSDPIEASKIIQGAFEKALLGPSKKGALR